MQPEAAVQSPRRKEIPSVGLQLNTKDGRVTKAPVERVLSAIQDEVFLGSRVSLGPREYRHSVLMWTDTAT